jgi:hypothetical protein
VRPSLEGFLLTNPSHGGDQSIVLVDTGGGTDIENLLSGNSTYETTPNDWVVNSSYTFPAFGTTACANHGTITCYLANGAILSNTTGTWTYTAVVNPTTGFEIGGAATSTHYLRGNGTNYVDSAIQTGDIPNTIPISGTGAVNQAVCQFSAGPPVVLGHCTSVVSAGGSCTCAN